MFVAQIIIILSALVAVAAETADDCGYNQIFVKDECVGK